MSTAIILTAFGTTSKAKTTYSHIEDKIRPLFPQATVSWAYSSSRIVSELPAIHNRPVLSLADTLKGLAPHAFSEIVIQSLHLFPGTEFHRLQHLVSQTALPCAVGLPLFTAPEDYEQFGEILTPTITARPAKAILILGHGTDHPSWTAYYTLEKILRNQYGRRIYVGVVEKSPDSSHLVEHIAKDGFREVCIIPLFLVTGMHYRRDIISENPASWKSRFEAQGLGVETIEYGLGKTPGIERIISRKVTQALARISSPENTE